MSKHTFETERLLIRPISQQDQALYCELYTNEKTMRNICPPLSTDSAISAFHRTVKLMHKVNSRYMTWTIVDKSKGTSIGITSLTWHNNSESEPKSPEIGIMLIRSAHGKKIPEEAMGSLMEYAFKKLAVVNIIAIYKKTNLPTAKFVKKLGFVIDNQHQPKDTSNRQDVFPKESWYQQIITKLTM